VRNRDAYIGGGVPTRSAPQHLDPDVPVTALAGLASPPPTGVCSAPAAIVRRINESG